MLAQGIDWSNLGVGVVVALVFLLLGLAIIKFVIPVVAASSERTTLALSASQERRIEMISKSHTEAVSMLMETTRNILEDNRAQRASCRQELEAFEAQMREQRQHDRAMQETAWRHINTQADKFDALCKSIEKFTT